MFGLISKSFGRGRYEAQLMSLCEDRQMLSANSRKVHDLCVGEDFLARFNRDHGFNCPQTLESFTFWGIWTLEGVVL